MYIKGRTDSEVRLKKNPDGCPSKFLPCIIKNIQLRLGQLDIHCVHAFFSTLGFESDGVAFTDFVDQAADVNKNFLPGGGINDEAEAFCFVEELKRSFVHY